MAKNITKVKAAKRKRLNEGALNVFAISLAVFPLFSLGLFTQSIFFSDPRHVAALEQIAEPATPRLFEEPLVSITFDDGWASVYSDAAPTLSEYQIPTTQYILPGEYDSRNYISLAQAKSLKKTGHEITSHTMTHPVLTRISVEEMVYQLEASKESLRKDGLASNHMHFAAPESDVNPTVQAYIQKYYSSHRNTYADLGNGIDELDINVSKTKFDSFEIIGFSVRNTTTPEQIKAALQYAKDNKGWLVLVYHQIDDSNSEFAVTSDVFKKQMKTVKDSQIKTATVGSIMEARRIAE